ncbi:MAG: hypothetical protein Q8N08_07645 [Methanobacteriaceae archaeon]|nr:hypothetical protein [Methanobacteriaceae archaeon]
MNKVALSVLILWSVIGVSLAAMYVPASPGFQKSLMNQQNSVDMLNNPGDQTDLSSPSFLPFVPSPPVQLGLNFNTLNQNAIKTPPPADSGNPKAPTITDNAPGNSNPRTGNSGNKYLVDKFSLNRTSFTAEITNQKNNVNGDGFFEITTNPAANQKNVLQNGTFSHSMGTFNIAANLSFEPVNDTKYYIQVYTNNPKHDNRVSKDDYVFII